MKRFFIFSFVFVLLSAIAFADSADELVGVKAPELEGGTAWLNSKPLKLSQLKTKVVLIDFWEYTCVNCVRTLPYLREWHKRYAKDGLVIIGVHTPEFEFSKIRDNVERAVKSFNIEYPVVLDNNYKIWTAFRNQVWPREYLIDGKGVIRYDHAGEGGYQQTEKMIQTLLRQQNPNLKPPTIMEPVRSTDRPGAVCYLTTPELYAGHARGRFGNKEFEPDRIIDYRDPLRHEDGLIYLNGQWIAFPHYLRHAQDSASLNNYVALKYHALEVYAVMKPEDGDRFKVYVFQDGRPLASKDKGSDISYDPDGKSFVLVNEPRMYNLTKNDKFGTYELRLSSNSGGFGLYAFTFGTCEKQ